MTEHLCPERLRVAIPCPCGEVERHRCNHCHDDPPAGHTCPCCGVTS